MLPQPWFVLAVCWQLGITAAPWILLCQCLVALLCLSYSLTAIAFPPPTARAFRSKARAKGEFSPVEMTFPRMPLTGTHSSTNHCCYAFLLLELEPKGRRGGRVRYSVLGLCPAQLSILVLPSSAVEETGYCLGCSPIQLCLWQDYVILPRKCQFK